MATLDATAAGAATAELTERLAVLETKVAEREATSSIAIVCFSGEWDRLYAAYTLAAGALAGGFEAHLFLTFWGAAAVRDTHRPRPPRSLFGRLIGVLLPGGPQRAPLSRLNMFGLGRQTFRWRMRHQGAPDLETLIRDARELGLQEHLCETSSELLGLHLAEFQDPEHGGQVDSCGVATFLRDAARGRMTLFV